MRVQLASRKAIGDLLPQRPRALKPPPCTPGSRLPSPSPPCETLHWGQSPVLVHPRSPRSHKLGMNRRRLLQILAALPFTRGIFSGSAAAAATAPFSRVRPGDPQWPATKSGRSSGAGLRGGSSRSLRRRPPISAWAARPGAPTLQGKRLSKPTYPLAGFFGELRE